MLSIASDFASEPPDALRSARAFAAARRPEGRMCRHYAIESMPSSTSVLADHVLSIRPSRIHRVVAALARRLGQIVAMPIELRSAEAVRLEENERRFVAALAEDLAMFPGASIVVAGDREPVETHVLAHALNEALANVGSTVSYAPPAIDGAASASFGLDTLADALESGEVETLVIASWNPAYGRPHRALELLARARQRVYLGEHDDETARAATWRVPRSHLLESWSMARGYDGTVTWIQPLVQKLRPGMTLDELLAMLLGRPSAESRALLDERWTGPPIAESLARGFVEGTAAPFTPVTTDFAPAAAALAHRPIESALELVLAPDPRIGDGDMANNPWLAELPEPMTKLVWDNAALVSPATAAELGVETGDVVELRANGRACGVAAFVLPSMPDGVVASWLGFGRRIHNESAQEALASGVGVDVSPLLPPAGWTGPLQIEKTDRTHELVTTQREAQVDVPDVIVRGTLAEFRSRSLVHEEELPSLHPEIAPRPPQWGMVIDLSICMGCSACVVACQVENNVPVVGKAHVAMGREMHWLRIDRYFVEKDGGRRPIVQPMLCQHCELAPCEYVCPTYATSHSPDGLNEMTYNRCVGTRFCSNNCPYKVRRFNFFDYSDATEIESMVANPEVTVRERGVMEKCTYCVQRIRGAQAEATAEARELRTDEVTTACAAACPTRAIVFGDITDDASSVAAARTSKRIYGVLAHLNTRPRTLYLARVENDRSDES